MKHTLIELFGWYGVTAVLLAYALNVFGHLGSDDSVYLWLNVTGSIGIVFVSWQKRNYQPLLLNLVWVLIAIVGLLQLLT